MTDTHPATRADELVDRLTLDEKASLTGGADVWHLPALDRVGVGALKMSDGPSGVRGERMGVRRSLSFPCGMAVGATWDVALASELGDAVGREAQSKGVHLVLGPTICISRTPLGGRTFESFAEDPHLSARLTVAYVRGTQAHGVGCCVKHFACNDQEHERMSVSVAIDPVTLREVHLSSFEAAVREAGAWAVMSAYNRMDGTYCGEQPELLGQILKQEWGFDGVVVSDWFGTHSTIEATTAGLDIEMPGPALFLGPKLVEAVDEGRLDEAVVHEHARRIARLLERTGLLDGPPKPDEAEDDDPARRAVAHRIAVGSTVLMRNEGALPLAAGTLKRVALVGPNAVRLSSGGGGSSMVTPVRDASLVEELRSALPGVEIVHEEGCRVGLAMPKIDTRLIGGGFDLEYFRGAEAVGDPLGGERLHRADYLAIGDPLPGLPITDFTVRARATFTPDISGSWTIGLSNTGVGVVRLDGEIVIDNREPERGTSFFGLGSTVASTTIELSAGSTHALEAEVYGGAGPIAGFMVRAGRPTIDDAMERAVAAARDADAAVVVVGTNSELETEGEDRTAIALAGDQDELIRRVAAVNPRTVVVLNIGAPVAMPWIDDVAAVVNVWFPGEEGASALAEVLAGAVDPSGRLPITFPSELTDTAPHADGPANYPGVDGTVTYGEGLLIGHRHFDANGIEPLFCFGHGLSYTTFEYGDAVIDGHGPNRTVRVPVTNTGDRLGTEVVQVYVGHAERHAGGGPGIERPVRQLAGFAKVDVAAGATVEATIDVGERAFARWSTDASDWLVDPGDYELTVGASSRDLRQRHTITLT